MKKFLNFYETIRIKFRRKYIQLTSKFRRKKLTNTDFTIVSNNCWGGFVYQSYNLPYNTPFIGMFIMPEDYLNLVANFESFMKEELKFIDPNDSKYYEILKNKNDFGKFPIAKLGTIELIMLHYHSEEEALKKWENRKNRINYSNILFKFNDQNGATIDQLHEFLELDRKNKIVFSVKNINNKDAILVPRVANYDFVRTSYEPFGNSKLIDINDLLNRLES